MHIGRFDVMDEAEIVCLVVVNIVRSFLWPVCIYFDFFYLFFIFFNILWPFFRCVSIENQFVSIFYVLRLSRASRSRFFFFFFW